MYESCLALSVIHLFLLLTVEVRETFCFFLNCFLSECRASNGQMQYNDVHVVNLSLVSDVQVKKEVQTTPEPPQSLNLQRVSIR